MDNSSRCSVPGCKQTKAQHDYLHSTHAFKPVEPEPISGAASPCALCEAEQPMAQDGNYHDMGGGVRQVCTRKRAASTHKPGCPRYSGVGECDCDTNEHRSTGEPPQFYRAASLKESIAQDEAEAARPPEPSTKCGKFAASYIPRRGEYFSCVLPVGHEGECKPGGTCVKHGPYVGKANESPICPKWPTCCEPEPVAGTASAPPKRVMWDIETLLGEWCDSWNELDQTEEQRQGRQRRLYKETNALFERLGDFEEWIENLLRLAAPSVAGTPGVAKRHIEGSYGGALSFKTWLEKHTLLQSYKLNQVVEAHEAFVKLASQPLRTPPAPTKGGNHGS